MKSKGIFLIIIFLFSTFLANAQNDSLTVKPKKLTLDPHPPKRAALYSAILPGAGQFYNKKYWKIPIVYAGLGVGAYSIQFNTGEYKFFKEQYKISIDTLPGTQVDPSIASLGSALIKTHRDSYRRNTEISYLVTGLWYVLNILDATVDAHLFSFDIKEDLSMRIDPYYGKMFGNHFYQGVGIKLYFK